MGRIDPAFRATGQGAAFFVLPRVGCVQVRALSLADRLAYRHFGARLDRNDLRLRFAGPIQFDDVRCDRLLGIDHDHEEALAAFDATGQMLGVARLVRVSPAAAELGLIVRSDLKARGLGRLLLDCLIQRAAAMGIAVVRGDVLYENVAMRRLALRAGFAFEGVGVMTRLSLTLDHARAMRPTAMKPVEAPCWPA